MNKQEQFFSKYGETIIPTKYYGEIYPVQVEEFYQMFKARLIQELVESENEN